MYMRSLALENTLSEIASAAYSYSRSKRVKNALKMMNPKES